MKDQVSVFKQIGIILAILLIGECVNRLAIRFIPGSVIGMLLLLVFLELKVIHVAMIDNVGNFLLKNLAFFFIVPGVSLLQFLPMLSKSWWKIALISIISTVIVMTVTGIVLQLLLKKDHE